MGLGFAIKDSNYSKIAILIHTPIIYLISTYHMKACD